MENGEKNLFEVKTAKTIGDILECETIEEKIRRKLAEELPHLSAEQIEKIAHKLLLDLTEAESRKAYAISILHQTRKYVQGYLKNYRVEVEVIDNKYPLELHVKVYF